MALLRSALATVVLQASGLAHADACADLARMVDPSAGGASAFFVASYATAGSGPLHRTAFVYDNAVTIIALIGCNEQARAQRIGDALLYALDHDRHWKDGRLRNAYAAGAVGGNSSGDGRAAVALPGWWDESQRRWLEDRYQVGSDTGNNAWAALALLHLARASGHARYREGAERIASWLSRQRDSRGAGGFTGGSFGHEPAPRVESWKSTEHNIDVAAVLGQLGRRDEAAYARRFVQSMWDPECRCFAVGTTADGITPNRWLALDVQVWALLSEQFGSGRTSAYHDALIAVQKRLRFSFGYAYSEALGGVWTEGTAQVALLYALLQRNDASEKLLSALKSLRDEVTGAYFATSVASAPTGFDMPTRPGEPLQYLRLPHLGATAWVALAERRFNPFSGRTGPVRFAPHPTIAW